MYKIFEAKTQKHGVKKGPWRVINEKVRKAKAFPRISSSGHEALKSKSYRHFFLLQLFYLMNWSVKKISMLELSLNGSQEI